MYNTLISPEKLHQNVKNPKWIVFDCRHTLADPDQGRRDYEQGHIPGAIFADLDKDLCGPILTRPDGLTETGRHPLPDVETFVATLNRWGVTNQTQVIAYDDNGGGLAAARLWWMLRWVGHDAVAVLDGGWEGWLARQYPVESGLNSIERKPSDKNPFKARVKPEMVVTAKEVFDGRDEMSPFWVFDSRAPERYRGETEPIDPVAGHIPWAKNAPYTDTQTPDGYFRSKEELKTLFSNHLGFVEARNTIFYCGSGVTAAANVLALKHAGLGDAKLYAGSWSDWISDPARPIAIQQSYEPPLDQFLTLGEDLARTHPWPNYLQYGITDKHIPDLIRMALDHNLNWGNPESPDVFAPLHAWRALGQLRAEAAIQPLMELFHLIVDSEWVGEELPEVYELIGPAAIPALETYLKDTSHSTFPRVTAISSLEKIGIAHPDARAECVEVLTSQLDRFDEQDEDLNGFLVGALVELKAVESAPVIERAFAAEMVEEAIYGDWEDIQVQLGLLEERSTPEPNYNPFFKPDLSPDFSMEEDDLDLLPFPKKKVTPKEKAKRKQAKQSRKINRKKKKKK